MNIAEILKQLPKGTKLYSPIFGEVEFVEITTNLEWIKVKTKVGGYEYFYLNGKYSKDGECMLFPAKNVNWYNYQIPFNDGDVIILTEPNGINRLPNIAIFKEYDNNNKLNPMRIYCQFNAVGEFIPHEMNVSISNPIWRKANPEEMANFYKEMHEAGYKFVNDAVVKILQPKFKVGDIITNNKLTFRIDAISNEHYVEIHGDIRSYRLAISEQDHWKLKKFDPTTLKPYDRVLAKFCDDSWWVPTMVSYVNSSKEVFTIDCEGSPVAVIPFEGHEDLIGTSNDPEPYYITWKED